MGSNFPTLFLNFKENNQSFLRKKPIDVAATAEAYGRELQPSPQL
jgi:hypothetical protein